jgi:serine/threonine-protein kinase
MYVVASSFLVLHGLTPYVVIWGPAEVVNLGQLGVTFDERGLRIRSVADGTPHRAAGLQTGDRVLAVAGHPIHDSRDWTVVLGNQEAGRREIWEILRGEERIGLEIASEGRPWEGVLLYLPYVGFTFGCCLLALFIGFRRPRDPVALAGAWFIMTASVALGAPGGWAVAWRKLPMVVQGFLWIPEVSRFTLEAIFLSFLAMFPRRLFQSKWPWALIWLPVLVTVPWRAAAFYSVIYRVGQPATAIPGWLSQAIFARTAIYMVTGVVIMVLSYRRLVDLNERRRVRVLIAGTAAGLMAAILGIWAFNFSGQGTRLFVFWRLAILPLMLACPAAFAYAILRHRVFEIPVIIRQGLQYALARGAVLGVVPVLAGLLLIDLAGNRQQPLAEILSERGWVYGGLAALALFAYWRRNQWLEAIDKRFFRERYNSERILRDVVEEIRSARSFEFVAARVAASIESALHPEFVSVLLRESGDPEYCTQISVPPGQITPNLAADSKLVGLVRVLGKPMEILLSDSQWLERRLPEGEIDFVRRARIDLLIPIAITPGRTEALMVLGIKRSEEPYTHADQELLEAIASSLALLLDHSQATMRSEPRNDVFKECSECGGCYDQALDKCANDNAALTIAKLPRILGYRYRLDRRLGRGGMGTVYEATDSALDRPVAVKVIRDDWGNHVDAAQRFQMEARAAAGFRHPNVVTVHDFGVDSQNRAFLVMELLEGGTVRDELRRRQRLDPARIVEIMRGVCSAVTAAHARNLIHRDLKPENIFLARRENEAGDIVKVLDFGLAKFIAPPDDAATRIGAETQAGALVGTPAYMSPEQLLGQSPIAQWDLWALAVIVYECLTGAQPFPASNAVEWRSAVLSGTFVPVSTYEWQEFFSSAFAVDQTRRPQSAPQFLGLLEKTVH